MTNKSIIAIFIIVFVGFSLIITIPILTLSNGLSNYGTIDELLTFEYTPDNSSPIEKLNLNVDVGDVEIKYITTPVNYLAKIIVSVAMTGEGIAGKISSSKYIKIININYFRETPISRKIETVFIVETYKVNSQL